VEAEHRLPFNASQLHCESKEHRFNPHLFHMKDSAIPDRRLAEETSGPAEYRLRSVAYAQLRWIVGNMHGGASDDDLKADINNQTYATPDEAYHALLLTL
jgi:hypothetical protein